MTKNPLPAQTLLPAPLASGAVQPPAAPGWGISLLEMGFIFLLFFVFAGSPPPDAGESCYLLKAKHYWNPSWCAGDLFLESADAHLTFYWLVGWITKFCSLETSTWIIRCLIWLLMAFGWQRLSVTVVPERWWSLLTAALFLLFNRWGGMAREIAVCGAESKAMAFGVVFLVVESLLRKRWRAAWLWVGVASALHVVIGGWAAIAVIVVWCLAGKDRPSIANQLPAILIGGLIALPGLIPALLLSRGADAATVAQANEIYVYQRLPHHLVIHEFECWLLRGSNPLIERFAILSLVWMGLVWLLSAEVGESWRRLLPLHLFVAATLGISLAGLIVDQSLLLWPEIAARILKYYFYRMSDVLVPAGVALVLAGLLVAWQRSRPTWGVVGLILAMLLAGFNLWEVRTARNLRRLPDALLQPRPTDDSKRSPWMVATQQADSRQDSSNNKVDTSKAVTIQEYADDWRATCKWIESNTPADALFLTPRNQQTFKWYAQRAEVATWKDIPQDASSIVQWYNLLCELFPAEPLVWDLPDHSEQRLLEIAQKRGAKYIVLDRSKNHRAVGLRCVYPQFPEENELFAVYKVPLSKTPPKAPSLQ